jgi:hypothetical protein
MCGTVLITIGAGDAGATETLSLAGFTRYCQRKIESEGSSGAGSTSCPESKRNATDEPLETRERAGPFGE